MFKKVLISFALFYFIGAATAYAAPISSAEHATANYFNTIKTDPEQLYIFLNQMPKGGDLHNHLSGATYAEDLLEYAKHYNLCIDAQSFILSKNPKCPAAQQLSNIDQFPDFYRRIIENWSLDNFTPGSTTAEAHFFPTFIKFGPIVADHTGEVLAELSKRAAAEKVSYLELMLTPFDLNLVSSKGDLTGGILKNMQWNPNFAQLRTQLMQGGLPNFVGLISARITAAEKKMRAQLKCDSPQPAAACQVKVRYQYITLREMPPLQVFAQLLIAFEAAKADPRIVGINLVQAEDGPLAMEYYTLTMQMLAYLHTVYPKVHITLHAGELAPDNVTPEQLSQHIRQAVEIAHAERIGHGVDIAYEDNAPGLMQAMASKNILVEINLTSNAKLLGIQGKQHPFPLYLRKGVPVALSTDDPGVLRTDITREFQRAVLSYALDYATLKKLARNSLAHAFIAGADLWQDATFLKINAACAQDAAASAKVSMTCQRFLAGSEKAQLQWQLEKQFSAFEKSVAKNL